MEKIKFKTEIQASAEKVWDILFGVESYPKWAAAFAEGSSVTTDWKKGSKALFHDESGKNGIFAIIQDSVPNKFLSIKHLGELKDGKEILKPDWGETVENYSLEEHDSITALSIEMDIPTDWKDYFQKTWPKALEKVKLLAEDGTQDHKET